MSELILIKIPLIILCKQANADINYLKTFNIVREVYDGIIQDFKINHLPSSNHRQYIEFITNNAKNFLIHFNLELRDETFL